MSQTNPFVDIEAQHREWILERVLDEHGELRAGAAAWMQRQLAAYEESMSHPESCDLCGIDPSTITEDELVTRLARHRWEDVSMRVFKDILFAHGIR